MLQEMRNAVGKGMSFLFDAKAEYEIRQKLEPGQIYSGGKIYNNLDEVRDAITELRRFEPESDLSVLSTDANAAPLETEASEFTKDTDTNSDVNNLGIS